MNLQPPFVPPPLRIPFDFQYPASILTPTDVEYEAGFQPSTGDGS